MNLCDSHIHILDERFATTSSLAVDQGMTLSDYRVAQASLGATRAVVVQAKPYGTDNRCLVDALSQLGVAGRGVAVVAPDISDASLDALHQAGVRGVRFSLWNPADAVASVDDMLRLAPRLAEFGWHLQLHMMADQIEAWRELLVGLTCPIVFDHMGRLPLSAPTRHRAFSIICDLAKQGHAWVKLSGSYLNASPELPVAHQAMAHAFIEVIPDRLVWGSDWPHVTEKTHPPTPDQLWTIFQDWCEQDAELIRLIGEITPAMLYQFDTEHV